MKKAEGNEVKLSEICLRCSAKSKKIKLKSNFKMRRGVGETLGNIFLGNSSEMQVLRWHECGEQSLIRACSHCNFLSDRFPLWVSRPVDGQPSMSKLSSSPARKKLPSSQQRSSNIESKLQDAHAVMISHRVRKPMISETLRHRFSSSNTSCVSERVDCS